MLFYGWFCADLFSIKPRNSPVNPFIFLPLTQMKRANWLNFEVLNGRIYLPFYTMKFSPYFYPSC